MTKTLGLFNQTLILLAGMLLDAGSSTARAEDHPAMDDLPGSQSQMIETDTDADPGVAEQEDDSSEAESGEDVEEKALPKPRVRRRYGRERQTQGTKAQNRVHADAVIKSYYSDRGRRLDVDPD